MTDPLGRIDVSSLLTIDVDSELRKLTQAQLQGPWQLPAEFVRWALHHRATCVEVELGRQQLKVRSKGGGMPLAILREFVALLDNKRSAERRHRALSALERGGALSLLALVGLEPGSLRVISPGEGGAEGVAIRWGRGEAAVEVSRLPAPGPEYAEIIVRGVKYERARARAWLTEVARFTTAKILIDGRPLAPLSASFNDAFSVTALQTPVPGTLALPREGELARLYLLQDGLVTTHRSIPGAPCFEAALELGGLAEPTASAARLRELVQPLVPRIVSAAFAHMLGCADRGASFAPRDRARLTCLLLAGVRRNPAQIKVIENLPLFRVLERDGSERWCNLRSVRQSTQDEGDERLLTALFPDQSPAEFAPEASIYILDEGGRAFLGEALAVGFRQPRRRIVARRGLSKLFHEGPSLLRKRDLFAFLRPNRQPIPEHTLTADERFFLVQLRAQFNDGEVAMYAGAGPVLRLGSNENPSKIIFPRDSPQVKAAVLAVAKDSAWVYPAFVGLLEGHQFPDRSHLCWKILRASSRPR